MKRLSDYQKSSVDKSIQFYIFAALLSIFLIWSCLTYVVERYSIGAAQNERLRHIALSIAPSRLKVVDLRSINVKLIHGPDDFVLQIWDGGRQVYGSHVDIGLAPVALPGFSIHSWRGERWMVFVRRQGTTVIQVSQSLDARSAMAARRALLLIVPLLLVMPLAVACIPFCVRRGLAPLTRISHDLRARDWHTLEPLSIASDAEEIVPVTEAIDTLLARLRQAASLQQAFVADASHELRTPLAALQILAQLLEEAPNPSDRVAALQSLREGIVRANRLSHQLLVTCRLDAETVREDRALRSLTGIVEQAIIGLSPLAASRNIDLTMRMGDDVRLFGSADQLAILVTNLVENAIRYTPQSGSVEVSVGNGRGEDPALIVDDSGPGIKPDERARVFDRFYRCLACDTPGSGLGLAIVAQVARRHDAEVVLEDSPLGGLRAIVRFRRQPALKAAA